LLDPLDRLVVVHATGLGHQPPDDHGARDGLDERVNAEADQGDAAGRDPCPDGDDPLEDVPANGHVLESQTSLEGDRPEISNGHGRAPRGTTLE